MSDSARSPRTEAGVPVVKRGPIMPSDCRMLQPIIRRLKKTRLRNEREVSMEMGGQDGPGAGRRAGLAGRVRVIWKATIKRSRDSGSRISAAQTRIVPRRGSGGWSAMITPWKMAAAQPDRLQGGAGRFRRRLYHGAKSERGCGPSAASFFSQRSCMRRASPPESKHGQTAMVLPLVQVMAAPSRPST